MKHKISGFILILLLTLFGFIFSGPSSDEQSQSAIKKLQEITEKSGLNQAEKSFKKIMNAPKGSYTFNFKELTEWISRLNSKNLTGKALKILTLIEPAFNKNPGFYVTLAQAYRKNGNNDKYYDNFKKMGQVRQALILENFLKKNKDKLFTTPEEVIQKHVKVTGGEAAWKRVNTLRVELSINDTNGNSGTLVRYYKRPYFFRQGMKGSANFTSTDGKTTWRVSGGIWKKIQGNIFKRLESLDDYFINYKSKGITYKYIGVEVLNWAPVYHLARTWEDGYQEELYFSIETGFLTEKLTPYNTGPSFYSLWDYQKTGNILFPNVQIRNVGDIGPPHGTVVKKIEVNIPLEDNLFRPQEK